MYAYKFYEHETHVSVPLISEYDGLRFVFNYYLMDVSEKDFKDPTTLIVNKYKTHYEKVSKEMGYKVVPPEVFINYLGADALQNGQYEKADALLNMNFENFPNSDKAYDAYGDFLVIQKDTGNAITYYKKAMSIKSNAATEQKLNSILPQATSSQLFSSYKLPAPQFYTLFPHKKFAGKCLFTQSIPGTISDAGA